MESAKKAERSQLFSRCSSRCPGSVVQQAVVDTAGTRGSAGTRSPASSSPITCQGCSSWLCWESCREELLGVEAKALVWDCCWKWRRWQHWVKHLPALKILVIIHSYVVKFTITRYQQWVKVIRLKNNFYFDSVFMTKWEKINRFSYNLSLILEPIYIS